MTENSIDMQRIFREGLEPNDFIKYSLPLKEEDTDDLISLNIGAEKIPLPPNHICNVLTDNEIESICYQRAYDARPSVLATVDRICNLLSMPSEHIPAGMIEAQMKLDEEHSYGEKSFKNFKRRLNRKVQRKDNKVINNQAKKKSKGMLQVVHEDKTLWWD
jgi:hypothetical protein